MLVCYVCLTDSTSARKRRRAVPFPSCGHVLCEDCATGVACAAAEEDCRPLCPLCRTPTVDVQTVHTASLSALATPYDKERKTAGAVRVAAVLAHVRAKHRTELTPGREYNGNARTADGGTLLHELADAGDAEGVRKVLEAGRGVHLDAVDLQGVSALHDAAAGGFTDVMLVLAEHGAELDGRDGFGHTPLETARKEMAKLSPSSEQAKGFKRFISELEKRIGERKAAAAAAAALEVEWTAEIREMFAAGEGEEETEVAAENSSQTMEWANEYGGK